MASRVALIPRNALESCWPSRIEFGHFHKQKEHGNVVDDDDDDDV